MRLRNEALATGSLLVLPHRDSTSRNSSLLLLVEGAGDIRTMNDIETACASLLDGGYPWSTVSNQRDLVDIRPRPDPARITRLEVAEFRGLSVETLRQVLAPALGHLQRGHPAFPNATRMDGSVVRGVDFLGREDELGTLWRLVAEEHQHVLLVAPRRSGKTSLLRHFSEQPHPGLHTLFIDAQEFRSAEALTAEFVVHASGKGFTEALKDVQARGWRTMLHHALQTVASAPGTLVLILDELVFMLDNLRQPEAIRALLTELDVAVGSADARLVIAGSFSLDQFASNLKLGPLPGAFGRLHRYALPPLAHERLAIDLRRVLVGTGLVADETDMDWLLARLDLSMPHPAIRFLVHLASAAHERDLDEAALDRELQTFLGQTKVFSELLNQLRDRAQVDLASTQRAEDVLDRLSGRGTRLSVADVRARLGDGEATQASHLGWMMETFPLTIEHEQVHIASKLFQRFWRMHRGLTP
ncbi:AAA family ATPase [Myxococcus sp. K15C18031901]|uniref:AAA family ATPase n=1 Tax=Myxococcus dinghuensis TaxID=2906761 RepID=UPI0020A777F1|nr:AAA family ATPase [Myxococcus dinghuensis]MCP3105275.1 AAA family ATPase [Myxococcus dinghuensis]